MPDDALLRLTQCEAGGLVTSRPCVIGIGCGCALTAVAEREDKADDLQQVCRLWRGQTCMNFS